VHAPVTFVILFRISADIGFELYTYPLFIVSFFLGQYFGSKIYLYRSDFYDDPLSSCLVIDTYKRYKS
jgi:hypothetical protein